MAETNGLLNRRTGNAGTAGSNPALSESDPVSPPETGFFDGCGALLENATQPCRLSVVVCRLPFVRNDVEGTRTVEHFRFLCHDPSSRF